MDAAPTPPKPDPSDPLIGEIIAGRYLIEVRLGEGAMGSVYRARHVKVGRPFAVKVLHPELLSDKKVMQRFEREAELAGRLRHPNVIGVVDVGETNDGTRYMVMDYAEGQDLADLLSEAPFAPARVMNLTRQMLEGLFHAHEAGLIHRDLKPENVIIERDAHKHEVPRIVDFGIAILKEGGENAAAQGRLTTNGLVLGTPHYMAPEQAVADPIDHRIDLFALGIVVYEMLCGKLPFDGTGAEVARANLMLDPPAIAQRVPYLEVDPLIEAFARRLMAKRRDARPATARAARELLDLIERDRPAAAAALGVTLPVEGPRVPAITQDSMPNLAPVSEVAPMLGPPMMVAPPHREARTSDVSPLRYDELPTKSRRALIIAIVAVVGIVLAIAIVIVKITGSSEPAATPGSGSDEVAVITPADAAPTIVTPGSGSAEPGPGSDVVVIEPSVEDGSGSAKATGSNGKAPKNPRAGSNTAKVGSNPPKPNTGSNTVTAGSAAPAITNSVVIALYKTVGRELEALRATKGDDAISDVQPRYRLVVLAQTLGTQDKREAAHATLLELQRDIRAKLK